MHKAWSKTYKEVGFPDEIVMPASNTSLIDTYEHNFKAFAEKTAYISMNKKLTYTEVDNASLRFATYLQKLGLEKGSRVAVMLPNILQYPIATMGILRAGLVLVNVNPLYTSRELEHQLKDSGAEVLLILNSLLATYESVAQNTFIKHVLVTGLHDLVEDERLEISQGYRSFSEVFSTPVSDYIRPTLCLEDTAVLQYTGGTTGVSKGAELTHGNLVANLLQSESVMSKFLLDPKQEQQYMLCALPLYHIFAFQLAMVSQRLGFSCVLVANPKDIDGLVDIFENYPPTLFPAVNTLINALVNFERFKTLNFDSLKWTIAGGMAALPSTAEAWHKLTGKPLVEGYGLSETSPIATTNPPNIKAYTGKIGIPMPSTDIAILDDDGKEVTLGDCGEISIRGPQVMRGYWHRPDETEKVMTADGFFRTGDIGFMDDKGYIKIVDRKKDMILVSGFNVYPNEIEEIVSKHPKVLEVAVIGVSDEKSGEVPKMFVVKKDHSLTEEEILTFASLELTAYKRPRYVEFIAELPKSNVGKILRKELR